MRWRKATPRWRARIESNEKVSSNWFGVIRVSVEGKAGLPVRITVITSEPRPWSTTCLTGTKPEYGPYFCEFSPLIPGRYQIAPIGLDASITVIVGRGAVAVVVFEPY